ncbi:protein ccsmst1 [Holotrichia oblita]|uniref:Protein ccsmst1 n=1 Tax=Holotrichia oblita TaxID=644536 RepID=A0ACB9SPY6_HOLOL|nr:protein ccsmst1 [Holotrichia oblita]
MSVLRTVYSRNILKRTCLLRTLGNTTINYAKDSIKVTEVFDEENKPIKYTATPAMKWQAKYSRIGTMDIRLWYEPYVIIISISIFLIYFCILREENDIDADLAKSLYEKIPGLEEQQLHVILQYNQEHGLETRDIIARLEEIRASKST